jgi:hypothetical protein
LKNEKYQLPEVCYRECVIAIQIAQFTVGTVVYSLIPEGKDLIQQKAGSTKRYPYQYLSRTGADIPGTVRRAENDVRGADREYWWSIIADIHVTIHPVES